MDYALYDKVSRKELEFVAYYMFINPKDDINSALSSYGQKKLTKTKPDAINYTKKTVVYFQGCYHHK